MARNECVIAASPQAVFDVLSDPRGYAYWVLGSREIRDADPHWPEPGSRFDHTVGAGPFRIEDHTVVEEMRPGRFLKLKAKARPFGTARVTLELEPTGDGTRVTMTEDAGDAGTAFLFTPLTHLLMWGRNFRSLERLAELAEGRRPLPGDEAGAPSKHVHEPGAVENPEERDRRRGMAADLGRGALAGLGGAAVMSLSTNLEMRLRARPPSDAPAKVLARIPGLDLGGSRRTTAMTTAAHVAASVGLGIARGWLGRREMPRVPAGLTVFGLAMVPELVVVPALGAAPPPWRWTRDETAIAVLHHGVFAVATEAAYAALETRS